MNMLGFDTPGVMNAALPLRQRVRLARAEIVLASQALARAELNVKYGLESNSDVERAALMWRVGYLDSLESQLQAEINCGSNRNY